MRPRLELTEQDGYAALRAHVVERAREARARHGDLRDAAALARLLDDRAVVRFPVSIVFEAGALRPGEFAWPRPRGERPADGFDLVVHPAFAGRDDVLPLLVAYHLPSVNWLDVVTLEEAELFGAELLGLERGDYYARLCELADGLAPDEDPRAAPLAEPCRASHASACGADAARDEDVPAVTSALVARLDPACAPDAVRARIALRPCFAAGEAVDGRLPLALQTSSAEVAEAETAWLAAQPGVTSVEVLFVDLGTRSACGSAQEEGS